MSWVEYRNSDNIVVNQTSTEPAARSGIVKLEREIEFNPSASTHAWEYNSITDDFDLVGPFFLNDSINMFMPEAQTSSTTYVRALSMPLLLKGDMEVSLQWSVEVTNTTTLLLPTFVRIISADGLTVFGESSPGGGLGDFWSTFTGLYVGEIPQDIGAINLQFRRASTLSGTAKLRRGRLYLRRL